MTSEKEDIIKRVQCPSCGAPIIWAEGKSSMQCPYCKTGLERVLPPKKETGDSTAFTQPRIIIQQTPITIPARDAARIAAGTSGAAACSTASFVLFFFILIGGIIGAIFLFEPNSPISINPSPLQVHDPFILVPGAADGPEDVIAMTYDVAGETYAVGRLSILDKKFLWRATPLESISDVRSLAANDTTLFLVEKETQLKALSLQDGSLLWEAELVDKLRYGDKVFRVQGDRVVALTEDYTVQVFDAATGEEAWRRRSNTYLYEFSILETSVAILDEVDDQTSLFFLDLADGSVQHQITPVCERPDNPGWGSEISSGSFFTFAPGADGTLDNGSVYFLYGSSPNCAERWDVKTGTLAWQSVDTENYIPSGDTLVLVTPDAMYYGYYGQLWAVDQTTTERRLVLENEDYDPLPLTMAGNKLIVRARRSRGSERFELWAINPVSGKEIWTYDLGEGNPFQPPNEQSGSLSGGDSGWDWRLVDDELLLLKAETKPNQFSIETLNLSDGSVAQTYSIPFETWSEDSYWIYASLWRDSRYWVDVETKMYVLNTTTGIIEYSYP